MTYFNGILCERQVGIGRISPVRNEGFDCGRFVVTIGTLSIPGVHVLRDADGQSQVLLPNAILGLCDKDLRTTIVKEVLSAWEKREGGVGA